MPILVRDEDLRRLCAIATQTLGTVELEYECSDLISRDFTDIESALEYDNPPSKHIRGVKISAFRDFNSRFWLKLDSTPSNVFISIEGDEQTVTTLSDAVDDRLASMKPWYSFLARADFVSFGFTIFVTAYLAFLVAAAIGVFGPSSDMPMRSTLRGSATGYLLGFGAVTLILGISAALNRLRSSIFPLAAFAIGHGAEQYRRLELVRWTVVIGGVLSLAIGLLLRQ